MGEKSRLKSRESHPRSNTSTSFSSGKDVSAFLRTGGADLPLENLRSLRNQLSLLNPLENVSIQDARVQLVTDWLGCAPGAQDLFNVLEHWPQPAVVACLLSILANVLSLLSPHPIHHSLVQPLIRRLTSPQWMRKLHSYLSNANANSELALVCLRLLNALSCFAHGKEQKLLMEAFIWDIKVLRNLLYMRRKSKDSSRTHSILARPDIRTLTVQFLLSFLRFISAVKTTFLEQQRDAVFSLFKGLPNDPVELVRETLECLWVSLWQDPKVKRTLKVAIFQEATIQHLIKLYYRVTQEGPEAESIPADIAHHFLLAICTHRGIGICFADNGWYPRQDTETSIEFQADKPSVSGGKVYNKILSNVLKSLKVTDDARQQELALKILRACPELISSYWTSASLTLEPRLSSKWISNIAFLGSVIMSPVPRECFFLPSSTASSSKSQYQPTPPSLHIIMENIFPSVTLKAHVSKALQHASVLVQHAAGLTLAKCLEKCREVYEAMEEVESALCEDVEGTWRRRRDEVEREARKRVPDFQVIVAFASAHQTETNTRGQGGTRDAMLNELGQRLLYLYHRVIPSMVAEARYDVSKSVLALLEPADDEKGASVGINGLKSLQKLHVLKMLGANTQFSWSLKPSPSSPSNIRILLRLYLSQSTNYFMLSTLTTLLIRLLGSTLLFSQNPSELELWLLALPSRDGVRGEASEAPDDTRLEDEKEPVLDFLESCLLRCAKTPHRYLEELDDLISSNLEPSTNPAAGTTHHAHSMSPLMATCLEQLAARVKASLFDPSDLLAVTTFLRKVVVNLLGNQPSLDPCCAIADKTISIVTKGGAMRNHPAIYTALEKECAILRSSVRFPLSKRIVDTCLMEVDDAVQTFLDHVEKSTYESTGNSHIVRSYELVDWLRLLDQPLSREGLTCTASCLLRLHPPAMRDMIMHLKPGSGLLWVLDDGILDNWCPADWLIIHAGTEEMDTRLPALLNKILGNDKSATAALCQRLLVLLTFRLDDQSSFQSADTESSLRVMVTLLKQIVKTLPRWELNGLKETLLTKNLIMQRLACSLSLPSGTMNELESLLKLIMSPSSPSDRSLIFAVTDFWYLEIRRVFEGAEQTNLRCIWTPFMSVSRLLELAEAGIQRLHCIQVMEDIFNALAEQIDERVIRWSEKKMRLLLSWQSQTSSESCLTLLLACLNTSVPLGIDGSLPPMDGYMLDTLTAKTVLQWRPNKKQSLEQINLHTLLETSPWSFDIRQAITACMYSSVSARGEFGGWLEKGLFVDRPIEELVPILSAFFEANTPSLGVESSSEELFSWLVKDLNHEQHNENEEAFVRCIVALISALPARRRHFAKVLAKRASKSSAKAISSRRSVRLCRALLQFKKDFEDFIDVTLEHALHWTVEHLSSMDDADGVESAALNNITTLLKERKDAESQFVDPLVSIFVSRHLCNASVMELLETLFVYSTLKPVNVNRHLQSMLQSPLFPALVMLEPTSSARDAFSRLLYTIFHLHPSNTCQATHVQPLVSLYAGSLSHADRRIFAIFKLFETQKRISTATFFSQWPQHIHVQTRTTLDALSELDSARVFRTVLFFPGWAVFQLGRGDNAKDYPSDATLYDPVFALLLCAQVLRTTPPTTALSWVTFFRTNIISLAFRCLSSRDEELRGFALTLLGELYEMVKSADMQERMQVIHVLDLLRDQIPARVESQLDSEGIVRLPSYITLLHAYVLRGIFYPSNFMYPITARFLLQRPELDIQDVPMLYGLLYSSGDDWKKERGWMIRFLADGMTSSEDWRLLKRRHTWDLLASLYQSAPNDKPLRTGILEFLANVTCHSQAVASLILKSSFIQWIEMQLLSVENDERIAWMKIIENVSTVADSQHIEHATKGEWQIGLVRCLGKLIEGADLKLLRLASRCLVRLHNGKIHNSVDLTEALTSVFRRLQAFETDYSISSDELTERSKLVGGSIPLPPHRSANLHQLGPTQPCDILPLWGETVQDLWRTVMKHSPGSGVPSDHLLWNELSSRLLLWRSICGSEVSPDGEWLRKEVIASLARESD